MVKSKMNVQTFCAALKRNAKTISVEVGKDFFRFQTKKCLFIYFIGQGSPFRDIVFHKMRELGIDYSLSTGVY